MERCEALDEDIVRVEQGSEHLPDLEPDGMKRRRVECEDERMVVLGALRGEQS